MFDFIFSLKIATTTLKSKNYNCTQTVKIFTKTSINKHIKNWLYFIKIIYYFIKNSKLLACMILSMTNCVFNYHTLKILLQE